MSVTEILENIVLRNFYAASTIFIDECWVDFFVDTLVSIISVTGRQ